MSSTNKKIQKNQIFFLLCLTVSGVRCHVLRVTFHMSLTSTATAIDPPPAKSLLRYLLTKSSSWNHLKSPHEHFGFMLNKIVFEWQEAIFNCINQLNRVMAVPKPIMTDILDIACWRRTCGPLSTRTEILGEALIYSLHVSRWGPHKTTKICIIFWDWCNYLLPLKHFVVGILGQCLWSHGLMQYQFILQTWPEF